jgi:chromosome partitioning protein
MHRIVLVAHKGGTGKTTVAVNLAGAIADLGHRVLLVDGDPQGGATIALGVRPDKPTLYEVLTAGVEAKAAARQSNHPNLDVLPADIDLAGAEVELPRQPDWRTLLAKALDPLEAAYDYVIIDTAPGLGVLPYLGLSGADRALLVTPADYLAYRTLGTAIDATKRAGVPIVGLVINATEDRTLHEADVMANIQHNYAEMVLGQIPRRVTLKDAALAGQPITAYAPHSPTAAAFQLLAEEIIRDA